jgi:hypothetical protein
MSRCTVSTPRKAEKQELNNHMWEKKVPGIQFDMFHALINSWKSFIQKQMCSQLK